MLELALSFGPWIVGILAAVAAVFAVKKSAKTAGKAEGEKVAAQVIAKERETLAVESINRAEKATADSGERVKNAIAAKDEVNRTSGADAVNELRRDFTRD